MRKSKGVTIVGVLIGIMILSIALAAQIKLLSNTIRRENDLRNLIIATSLAREGIEIAFAWRISDGWDVLKAREEAGTSLCPDITDTKLTDVNGNVYENIINNCNNNRLIPGGYPTYANLKTYLYGNPENSTFSIPTFAREVKIEDCDDNDNEHKACLQITSKVSWLNATRDVQLTKKIYNWYVP